MKIKDFHTSKFENFDSHQKHKVFEKLNPQNSKNFGSRKLINNFLAFKKKQEKI